MELNNPQEGKYIVLEGQDGTGKSTQVGALAKWLKSEHGIDSYIPEEPGGTPFADALRQTIKNGDLERSPEANLLTFTASRHEIWQVASRELVLGKWVISSRNWLSTVVYQGYGEGLDQQLIIDTTRQFTDDRYMSPDYMAIFTFRNDASRVQRINARNAAEAATKKDTFESRDDSFQAKLHNGYDRVALEYEIDTIDAARSIEEIQEELQQRITDQFFG